MKPPNPAVVETREINSEIFFRLFQAEVPRTHIFEAH